MVVKAEPSQRQKTLVAGKVTRRDTCCLNMWLICVLRDAGDHPLVSCLEPGFNDPSEACLVPANFLAADWWKLTNLRVLPATASC